MVRVIELYDIADARDVQHDEYMEIARAKSTCSDCIWCCANNAVKPNDMAVLYNMITMLCVPAPGVSRDIKSIAIDAAEETMFLLKSVAWCRSLDFMTNTEQSVGDCPEFEPIVFPPDSD